MSKLKETYVIYVSNYDKALAVHNNLIESMTNFTYPDFLEVLLSKLFILFFNKLILKRNVLLILDVMV